MNKNTKSWEKRSLKYGSNIRGVLFGDRYPMFVINSFHSWSLGEIANNLPKTRDQKVLDVGCGYGRVSIELASRRKNLYAYGIDISKNYVQLYNSLLKKRGEAKVADLLDLPFKKDFFDYGFMIAVLMYLTSDKDRRTAANELTRVIKTNGRLTIIERTRLMQFFDFKNFTAKQKVRQGTVSVSEIKKLFTDNSTLKSISYWPNKLIPLFASYSFIIEKNKKADRFTKLFEEDLTYDVVSRATKAKKLALVLQDHLGDLSKLNCLDVGSSTGLIAENLSNYFGQVTGVDVDESAIVAAKSRVQKKNVHFKKSSETKLPFNDNTFDVVVFNQVYEHTQNPVLVMKEVRRVLKKNGVCLLGARNKYGGVYDGHYKLPFLSWLPSSLAKVYFTWFTSKDYYDVNLLPLWELQKFTKGFIKKDYTLEVISSPEKYGALDVLPKNKLLQVAVHLISIVLYPFIPNYIWVLQKKV